MESLSRANLETIYSALARDIAAAGWPLRGLLIGLGALAAALAVILVVHFSRIRGRRIALAGEIYLHLIHSLGLSRSEYKMADRISSFHRPADKRYRVLLDEEQFEDCAARAQERGGLEEITLAALRLKLDFGGAHPEGAVSSSGELAPGTPLMLVQKGRPAIPGILGKQESDWLAMELDPGTDPPTLGVPLSVYFHTSAGVFMFRTHALRLVESTIHLDQADNIRPAQRRRYYRKEIRLPVYIMLRDKVEEPIRAAIVDLSGGGASLENPGMDVHPGDELGLSFSPAGATFRAPARVVRLSAGGTIMHVQFQRLSESARDRLIGSLFEAQSRA